MTLPPTALVAFSAGTGGRTDVHAVRAVRAVTITPGGYVRRLTKRCRWLSR